MFEQFSGTSLALGRVPVSATCKTAVVKSPLRAALVSQDDVRVGVSDLSSMYAVPEVKVKWVDISLVSLICFFFQKPCKIQRNLQNNGVTCKTLAPLTDLHIQGVHRFKYYKHFKNRTTHIQHTLQLFIFQLLCSFSTLIHTILRIFYCCAAVSGEVYWTFTFACLCWLFIFWYVPVCCSLWSRNCLLNGH